MISVSPLEYPPTLSDELVKRQFGAVITGVEDINNLTSTEESVIIRLLYEHDVICFKNVKNLTPAGQFKITNMFDKDGQGYGHGNNNNAPKAAKSVLLLQDRSLPVQPQIQLIGYGTTSDPEILHGLPAPYNMVHGSHRTNHITTLSDEDLEKGYTRFFRWHMDSALYKFNAPIVTSLCARATPHPPRRSVVKYDDGTGDELDVPNGGTAFFSTSFNFELLSLSEKVLLLRSSVTYAPHPYIWMSKCKMRSTGFGIESEGKEMTLEELPPWEEKHVKTWPCVWKNPVTGRLHLQVHQLGVREMTIAPLPRDYPERETHLYPDGAKLTDLKTIRDLLYSMQRPGMAPQNVYTHDWEEGDLVLFHNRGVLHCVTGEFKPGELRALWQCNLAATYPPEGPSNEDLKSFGLA